MPRYGMVIDLDRCMGCRACMEACKVENNTGQAVFWMYVFRFEEGEYPNVKVRFMPRPCMHCDNAPCVKVCPVGARFKRDDGLVATDFDRCIGCRYCQVACPYGVNYFNWMSPKAETEAVPISFAVRAPSGPGAGMLPTPYPRTQQYLNWEGKGTEGVRKVTGGEIPPYKNPDLVLAYGKEQRRIAGGEHPKGVIEKCTFCVHRVEKGLEPACVANCPVFALHFGDLDDPNSDVSRLLASKRSFRLEEGYNTEPRVHYVGGASPGTGWRQIEPVKARV